VSAALRLTGLAVAFLVLISRPGGAQSCSVGAAPGSCSVSTAATLTVGKVVQLTLATTASVLATPTVADYAAGYLTGSGQLVSIRSNASVVVLVAARAANWSATNTTAGVTAWATKPSTDLQLGSSTTGPFTPLTTGGYTLSSSGATATLDLPVAYKVLLDWRADTPGQYSLDVVYTVTAP
jgi:hypothetical protein